MRILPFGCLGSESAGLVDHTSPRTARDERGFTMLEVLVVAAVTCVLAAVIVPTYIAIKERARDIQCLSNMRQISMAMNLYLAENRGIFPPCVDHASWRGTEKDETDADIAYVLNDYIGAADGTHKNNMDSKVWVCPEGNKFGWRSVSPGSWTPKLPDPPYYIGAYDKGLISGAPNAVYAPHNITYRYNSKLTRGVNSMVQNVEMLGSAGDKSEYPQNIARLKKPGQAALFWDMPEQLAQPNFSPQWDLRYKYHRRLDLHGKGVNCLFVDGHVETVPIAFNPINSQVLKTPGSLWWYASEDLGWTGAVYDYYYNPATGLGY